MPVFLAKQAGLTSVVALSDCNGMATIRGLICYSSMKNETDLVSLRPDLDLDTTRSTPEELFQNNTLRPILKMQHTMFVHLFRHYIHQ